MHKPHPQRRLRAPLLTLLLSGTAIAAPVPEGFLDPGARLGHIDDLHSGGLVINDRLYQLDPAVIIQHPRRGLLPASVLGKGQRVGFTTGADRRHIDRLWLLPDNYQPAGAER